MIKKIVLITFLLYIFSPLLMYFSIEEKFSGIEYHKTEVTQLEEINIEIISTIYNYIPETLHKGEDMTMFYFRYIRPTLADYNENYKPVIVKSPTIPKKKLVQTN